VRDAPHRVDADVVLRGDDADVWSILPAQHGLDRGRVRISGSQKRVRVSTGLGGLLVTAHHTRELAARLLGVAA